MTSAHKGVHNAGCTYYVYCDESRHTSDPGDRYMVIGGISVPAEKKREIVGFIHRLRAIHQTQGEIGWKRISPNRRQFYMDLLQLFLDDPDIQFRCIVVDRQARNDELFNDGDAELGFYKLYYLMLVYWLSPGCRYRIYLDWQKNRDSRRFVDLRDILRRKLSGRAAVDTLEPAASHELELLQLTDLLIGAVGYAWNRRGESPIKVEFIESLTAGLGMDSIRVSTPPSERKFNIFSFPNAVYSEKD